MTVKEHNELYNELKQVISIRGYNSASFTEAQKTFVLALEQAAFGAGFLKVYSEMVDKQPDISIRNLHAFCIGFALGKSKQVEPLTTKKTYH